MPSEDQMIAQMLAAKRIAIVGLSDDPGRASFDIAEFLLSRGREIVPVNPTIAQVLGRQSYKRLEDVPGKIDLVNVFRRPEYCADVVRSAIAVGAGGIWLQLGIISEEARRLAEAAHLPFVQNRCIKIEMFARG
jgi:predicted CoA-binding protein